MNKRLVGVFAVLVVAVVLIVSWLAFSGSSTTWAGAIAAPSSFSTAAAFGQGSLVFTNGRAFVSYDYMNGKTQLLSPDNMTPYLDNVDSIYVSADKQYLVFHTTLTDAGSALYTQAKQAGIDPNQPSWWVYNIAQQTFRNLPQDVSSIALDGPTLYTLTNDSPQDINSYDLASLHEQTTHTVPSCSGIYPTSTGMLLNTTGGKVLFTKDYTVFSQLFTSTSIASVSADGTTAVGVASDSNGGSRLVRLDLQKQTSKTIADNINSQITPNAQGDVIFTKTGGSTPAYYTYNVVSNKVVTIQLGNPAPGGALPDALLGDQAAILTNSNDTYLIGKSIAAIKNISTNYNETVTAPDGHPIVIAYYPDQGAILVTLDAAWAQQERNEVYAQLEKNGLNPNLLDIQVTLYTPLHTTP